MAPLARTVLQQCVHARLQVSPPGEDSGAEWVQVGRGMVIYVCFFKGATEDMLPKMVSTLLNQRLCEGASGGLVSVLEVRGSVLVVPQATLGGRAKGRAMQYHGNIGKEDGLRLYRRFVSLCRAQVQAAGGETRSGAEEAGAEVKAAGGETRSGAVGAGAEVKAAGGETRSGAVGAGAEVKAAGGETRSGAEEAGAEVKAAGGETRSGAEEAGAGVKAAGGETRSGAEEAGAEVKAAGGETRSGAVGAGAEVKHGTYGNRQVLQLDTNGPYTHLMEF